MELDSLPTLEQIRTQCLLSPPMLSEMEEWFRRSCLLGRSLPMSAGLMLALHRIGRLSEIDLATATRH